MSPLDDVIMKLTLCIDWADLLELQTADEINNLIHLKITSNDKIFENMQSHQYTQQPILLK